MTLWQTVALAVIGAAALIFGIVRRGDKKRRFIALTVAGALTVLAAFAYMLLTLVFLGAVE